MAAAVGSLTKLGFGATDPATERYSFISENIQCLEEFIDAAGIVGSRSHPKERVRTGIRRIGGALVMNPTPVDLDTILPRILGAAESTDVFAVAETLPEFVVEIDRISNRFLYSGCKVNRATFRASAGQPLELTLDIIGKDETVRSQAFPSINLDTTTNVYVMSDTSTFTIAGNTVAAPEVELVIDNQIDTERFLMSNTLVTVEAIDRLVTINFRLPYGDYSARYAPGVAGVAVVWTLTNGNVSLSFSLAAVQFPRISPVVNDRGEVFMQMSGVARKSSSTAEIVTTSDSAP